MKRIISLIALLCIVINIGAQEMSSGGTQIIHHKTPDKKTEGVAYLSDTEMEAV